jgi:glutathione peroxidase
MKWLILTALFSTTAFAVDFHSVKEKSITGQDFSLDSLKGKTVLVVNIASQCGYTPQMTDLEALHQKFKGKNFTVLGVPTNDFGGQTPQDDKAMMEFCQKNYSATFPILTKKTIVGKDKRELYKVLTENSAKKFQAEVGWNFEKFLVNKKGEVVGRYKSSTKPLDEALTKDIEKQL